MSDVLQAVVAPVAPVVHQGRWGYYQVSYAEYQQAKRSHRILLEAMLHMCKSVRIYRKTHYHTKHKALSFLKKRFKETEKAGERPNDYVRYLATVGMHKEVRELYFKMLKHYQAIRKPYSTQQELLNNISVCQLTDQQRRLFDDIQESRAKVTYGIFLATQKTREAAATQLGGK